MDFKFAVQFSCCFFLEVRLPIYFYFIFVLIVILSSFGLVRIIFRYETLSIFLMLTFFFFITSTTAYITTLGLFKYCCSFVLVLNKEDVCLKLLEITQLSLHQFLVCILDHTSSGKHLYSFLRHYPNVFHNLAISVFIF